MRGRCGRRPIGTRPYERELETEPTRSRVALLSCQRTVGGFAAPCLRLRLLVLDVLAFDASGHPSLNSMLKRCTVRPTSSRGGRRSLCPPSALACATRFDSPPAPSPKRWPPAGRKP